ncbi:hypothetical protein SynBIOSE41_03448 [Synechococcus sp. BIOS-E4-1]|nr:hypothetical protein SynBIOSE41_03448 [Synechococcus sp. BIOS-E4-1]
MSPEQRSGLQRHHNSTADVVNIGARLLCGLRPSDERPGDTAITTGQIVIRATSVNRIKFD